MTNKPTFKESDLRQRAEGVVASQSVTTETVTTDLDAQRLLHELQIHQIELEMQNEELRRTIAEKSDHEAHLRNIITLTPAGYFHIDLEGRFLDVNDAWLRMHGYDSKDEVIGKLFSMVQVESSSDSALAHLAELQRGKTIPSGEFASRRKDGTIGYHIFTAHPVVQVDSIVGYEWFIIDISERKLTERLQGHYSAIIESSSDAIIGKNLDGLITSWNPAAERMFGYTVSEMLGQPMSLLIPPEHKNEEQLILKKICHGEYIEHFETVRRRKNGELFPISVTISPIKDGSGTIIGAAKIARDITERRLADQALVDSQTRLRAVLDGVQSAVITITEHGTIESFNHSAEIIFGYSTDEVVGKNVLMLIPEPHKSKHESYLGDYIRTSIKSIIGGRRDILAERKGGLLFDAELGVSETVLNDTKLFIGSITDISFRKEAEAELRIAATAFESLTGMVVTDFEGTILRVNRAFSEISGYKEKEVIGKNPRFLKSGRHKADFYQKMWESIKRDGGWQGEIWDRRKNGEEYPKWLSISAVKGADGIVTHYVGTHYDITARKQAEEKINELAFFDQLTGLPNRTLLMDRLKQAMAASSRNGSNSALLFIDLDNFKTLNDTLGHDMGDLLLKQVAQRLTKCVREEYTTARLGGDEFVVMLTGLGTDKRAAASQTEVVGRRILAELNQPYQLKDEVCHSTPSIGATLFSDHNTEIEALLKQADLAMYRSKESGRNTMRFFDPDMETVVMERAALEKALREAVKEGQFLLHYQAQVAGGKLIGCEVLVRWQHPLRGMVSPAEFIPLAEETRLILPLGQWVLETACSQLAVWATRPEMEHLTVAVNVSAHQFLQDNFVEQVLAVLRKTGANPKRLKLELTESILVSKVDEIVKKMYALKAEGVGFSLDDFGTGYSSLSYLKRMPLDQLKIDQSFVRDVLIDPNGAAIAKTVIALAQSLGFGVIAEGIETTEQRDFLADNGCHAYQGYFFSRPLPIEGFEEYANSLIAL
ncbi:MAG: PAS domain S-box protein [Desulfuromonadales bacterium]